MRKIFIKYNPYKIETEVKVDGIAPKKNSQLNFGEKRLQEWIEELPDILLKEYNTRDFNITFHGTTLDYEDLVDVSEKAKEKNIRISLEHRHAKETTDKEKAIENIFEEIKKGPFEELKEPDIVRAFELAKSSNFEVNVIATMSAGKSTLINSLLGKKLMPAKQEACTATITEIADNDTDNFTAKAYNKNGILVKSIDNLTYKNMEEFNSNPDVSKIRVEGDIPFVEADDISLVLVDTPGPNNSRDAEHKAATYRMLSESSKAVVLYILNATQLGTNDDEILLSHVAESMRVGGKQSRDRFIFVVNKLDTFNKNEDKIETALSRVSDYLKDHGIENANIFPASALTALDLRTLLKRDDLDDDDDNVYDANGRVRKLNNNDEYHFEKYAPLTPSSTEEIKEMLEAAKLKNDKNAQAEIHSGIISIEMAIKTYVRKYAKTAKIKNIVDTFSKKLESAHSMERTKEEIALNAQKHEQISANIDIIKKKLADGKNAQEFKNEINKINYDKEMRDIVNKILNGAQNQLEQQIKKQRSSANKKLSKAEAERVCATFSKIAENLQANVQVKLEDVITNNMKKNAEKLLEQYKKRLSDLASEISLGEVTLNPFEMMEGSIKTDSDALIRKLSRTESIKIGEEWVENTKKRWWKPWTWFEEKGHWETKYANEDYVDGDELTNSFFAPVEAHLYKNTNNAIEYSKEQTETIKKAFSEKFDELDKVLKDKLTELQSYTEEGDKVKALIAETQARLNWIEDIQNKVNDILEI